MKKEIDARLESVKHISPVYPVEGSDADYRDYWMKKYYDEKNVSTLQHMTIGRLRDKLHEKPAHQCDEERETLVEKLNRAEARLGAAAKLIEETAAFMVVFDDVIHSDAYKSVFMVSQMHVGNYRGPTYGEQYDALKKAKQEYEESERRFNVYGPYDNV